MKAHTIGFTIDVARSWQSPEQIKLVADLGRLVDYWERPFNRPVKYETMIEKFAGVADLTQQF